MSEVLKILLSTSVSEILPSFLETYTELNRNINLYKKNLYSVSSFPYRFSQCNRKSSNPKVPVIGQILSEDLNEDYLIKKTLDSGEFLKILTDRSRLKVYIDEIIENPFELIIAKLQHCSACNFIAGEIKRNTSMQTMVWNTDNKNFVIKASPLLLLSTARPSFDVSGMLIETPVVIPVIPDIAKYLTSGYER